MKSSPGSDHSVCEVSSDPPVCEVSSNETPSLLGFFSRGDLRAIALACMVGDCMRGLVFPTLSQFVERLGGEIGDVGIAVAAFSTGRILTAPIFGMLSEKRGDKIALIGANCVLIMGCLMYMAASCLLQPSDQPFVDPPAGGLYLLFAAQLVIGFGCGTLGVTRSYVVGATSRKNRPVYVAYLTAVQYGSFTVMPILGSVLSALADRQPQPAVINQFSAPAAFVIAASVISSLFLLYTIRDDTSAVGSLTSIGELALVGGSPVLPARVHQKQHEYQMVPPAPPATTTNPEEGLNVNPVAFNVYLILAGGMLLNMTTKGTIGVFETLGNEYARHNYLWGTLRTGTFFAICGAVGVTCLLNFQLLVVFFGGDYNLMVGGFALMALSCGLLAAAPQVPQFVFAVAIALQYCVAYPVGHTALLGKFSQVLVRGKQGFVLGLFASAGSVARVVFPIVSSVLTQHFDESVAFALMCVLLILSVGLLVAFKQPIDASTA